jgi:hypothetical protein
MAGSQLTEDLEFIESLSKAFAVGLGLLYLLGFLVVASYLSRYGVASFDVLQLQYLIAGIWAIGPPVLLGSIYHIQHRFEERAAPDVGKFNWRRVGISTVFSGVPAGAAFSLLASVPNVRENMTWSTGIRLFSFYIGIWMIAELFWISRQVPQELETWWRNKSHAAPLYLSAIFVLVLGYAIWFAVRIYPLIPFSLGGGKPLMISFFEGEKRMPEEVQKPTGSAKRSIPYKLLITTDKYYVVVSPSSDERALQVSRDSVAGIVILSSN